MKWYACCFDRHLEYNIALPIRNHSALPHHFHKWRDCRVWCPMLQQHFNYSLHESHFSCEDKTSQSDSNSPLLSILPHSIGSPFLDNFQVSHKGSIPSLPTTITQSTSNTPTTRYLFSVHHSTSQGRWICILLVTDTLSPQSSGWAPISSSLWLLVHLLSCLEHQTLPQSYYSLFIRATAHPVPKLLLSS